MTTDPAAIADALAVATRLDKEWMRKVPETDRRRAPWMPFPRYAYLAMLLEAIPDAPGFRLLAVGCGPGSELILAQKICGLWAYGIEIEPEAVKQARELGLDVTEADAAAYGGYGDFDMIWFNRVFRDQALQAALEKTIWDQMTPGAVVICANLEAPPPSARFFPVLDDWEARRGIWYKVR